MDNSALENIFFTWDIQYQCNYHCTYCFLHFEKNTASIETVYLKPHEWLEIWKDVYNRYGQSQIQITGGEPFIYPDFMDLISELSKIHLLSFSTNLCWDVDEFIAKISPERVKIDTSFHPEFANIDQFLEKVLILKKNNYLTSVTMVGFPPMLDTIRECGEKFKNKGIKLVIYPYRGEYQDRIYPDGYTADEKKILQSLSLQIGEYVSDRLRQKHLGELDNESTLKDTYKAPIDKAYYLEDTPTNPEQKLCLMGNKYAKILPDGEAYRCCTAIWDETKLFHNWGNLGNLVKRTFRLLDNPCRCDFWQICACYKSMVIGEEKRWFKDWSNIRQIKEISEIKNKLNLIKKIRDEKRYDETLGQLQEIIIKFPKYTRALTLLAEIYVQMGRLSEAEEALKTALENNLDPDDLSWVYRVFGMMYRQLVFYGDKSEEKEENLSRAFDYLSKAIKAAIESNNAVDQSEAYHEMANAYHLSKDLDKALEYIELSIQYSAQKDFFKRRKQEWIIEPELDSIRELKDKGLFYEAKYKLQLLLDKYPNDINVLTLLAEFYMQENKLLEAEGVLREGIKNDVSSDHFHWPYILLSRIYKELSFSANNPEEKKAKLFCVSEYLSKALKIANENNSPIQQYQVYYEKALLYHILSDFDNAIACIELAIRYNPRDDSLKKIRHDWVVSKELDLIKQLRDRCLFDESRYKLHLLLAKYPNDTRALTLLAEIYMEMGRLSEAEEALKTALENNLDPDDLSWVYRVFGMMYRQLVFYGDKSEEKEENLSRAFDYLSKAIKAAIESNNAVDQSQGYYEIAKIYYMSSELNKAMDYIELAIQYNPQNDFLKRTKECWLKVI